MILFVLLIPHTMVQSLYIKKIKPEKATNQKLEGYGRILPVHLKPTESSALEGFLNDQQVYINVNRTNLYPRVTGKKTGGGIIVSDVYFHNEEIIFESPSNTPFIILLGKFKNNKLAMNSFKAFYVDQRLELDPGISYQGPYPVRTQGRYYQSVGGVINRVSIGGSKWLLEIQV